MKRITLEALGLSEKEHVVLNVLQQLPIAQKVSNIALQCEMPHTTVSFILRKLEKRKLATRIKMNNHFGWKYRKNLELSESLSESFSEKHSKDSAEFSIPAFLNVVSGMQNITKEFIKILELAPAERLYSIQGSGISKTILKKVNLKFLSFFHHAIKKQKIIIEGVIAQSVLDLFNKMPAHHISTHLDRLTIVYVLPDEFLDFPLDVFVFRDNVLLIDYESERAVHIQDTALVQTYKALFHIAEEYGKKIN